MPIRIDESRRPIVVVTFVGTATDAEFDQYLQGMTDRGIVPNVSVFRRALSQSPTSLTSC